MEQFDFLPETFVIPQQFGEFVQAFKSNKERDNLWIVKPTNLSRGRGIYIVDDVAEVHLEDEPSVIQRYIANPMLINGTSLTCGSTCA